MITDKQRENNDRITGALSLLVDFKSDKRSEIATPLVYEQFQYNRQAQLIRTWSMPIVL